VHDGQVLARTLRVTDTDSIRKTT